MNERYIRQTVLKDFGPEAQQKMGEATVLVVGIGGLGIPVLQYLNAMGVGTLGMIDQDLVGISNLQRQVLYSEKDVGKPKLTVALDKLKAQNHLTQFRTYDTFLGPDNALEILAGYDIIVDASDNFATRYVINDACVILNTPFVYGALHGFEGQVSVFNYRGGPTYRCLFPDMPSEEEIPDCNENGVLGVIPGIVGSLQALEVVKTITGIGEVLSGKLLLYNGLQQSVHKIKFEPVPENLSIKKLRKTYRVAPCSAKNEITIEKFRELMASKPKLQLIDVRTAEEYNTYHLENARNIPLNEIEGRLGEIEWNEDVYLLCQSGKRSQMAQRILSKLHPQSGIFQISGGINTYSLPQS
jgi:adenylyltransferase/sulfurtransferase